MALATVLYVNNFNTARLGLVVETTEGWASAPVVTPAAVALPGRVGVYPMTAYDPTERRTIRILGHLRAASLTAMGTAWDELKARAGLGLVELRFVDRLTRFSMARLVAARQIAVPTQFLEPTTRVELEFQGLDPYCYDTEVTVVAFGVGTALQGPCPLGTAPSAPFIRLSGAATNPVITLRDWRGTSVGTMGFTVTLDASDFLEINGDTMTIALSNNGVVTDGINLLTSGDFPVLAPRDADFAASAWPTLEVSAGSGEAFYRKAWG